MTFLINYRLLLIGCLIYFASHLLNGKAVNAKEIEATNEWQLLQEGDTIPSGLHVRMDFETGEKWVKLMDEEENESQALVSKESKDDKDGGIKREEGIKITHLSEADIQATGTTKVTAGMNTAALDAKRRQNFASSVASLNDHISEDHDENDIVLTDGYNYKMMHRTFSSLPSDEQERMGGIPPLPDIDTAPPEEIQKFKDRMLDIWLKRQAELKQVEDELVVDMPKIIQQRIIFLKNYLENSSIHLRELLVSKNKDDNEVSDIDDQSDKVNDILAVLYDLEYHLSDLDMARDFHMMGGWPLLVSILSDSVHTFVSSPNDKNETDLIPEYIVDQMPSLIWEIQSAAAWAIGTAVKNAEEFHLWALEDYSDAIVHSSDLVENEHPITVISLLLSSSFFPGSEFSTHAAHPSFLKKKQKSLYALSSLLRGNRRALRHFYIVNGPSMLIDNVLDAIEPKSGSDLIPMKHIKFASKALSLACDLITDIVVHPDGGDFGSKAEIADIDEDIIASFTTEKWCNSAKQLIQVVGNGSSLSMQENVLRSVTVLAPYCTFNKNDLSITEKLTNQWEKDESIDSGYKNELIDLVHKIRSVK